MRNNNPSPDPTDNQAHPPSPETSQAPSGTDAVGDAKTLRAIDLIKRYFQNPAEPPPSSLPPPDADPAADAEARRIADMVDGYFQAAAAVPMDQETSSSHDLRPHYDRKPLVLSWEEVLNPRVLALLRPESLCAIREYAFDTTGLPPSLLDRAAHFRGPCPDWVRALVCWPPRLLPVMLDKVRDDGQIRRVLAALSSRHPGGMPMTLLDDVREDAFGRFAIHATTCGFHWSPGAVAILAFFPVGPRLFAYLLDRDEEFNRRFPPEKLLPILLCPRYRKILPEDIDDNGSTIKRDDGGRSRILPRIEQLEKLRPGSVRACAGSIGGGNLLRLARYSEEAEFLIRHGADPDAPDFTGISDRVRRYCNGWYAKWRESKKSNHSPPPFQPPEPRPVPAGSPPPFPPEILHPFTRVVLFDDRPAAIAADLRAHRAELPGYLHGAKFRSLSTSPRVLRDASPEFARELLLLPTRAPYSPRQLRTALKRRAEDAAMWEERFTMEPETTVFVRTFRWLAGLAGRKTFPTRADGDVRQGARFPPKGGEAASDIDRLRRAVAWDPPDEAAAMVEHLAGESPSFLAWAELGILPGAGLLWAALLPRLPQFFTPPRTWEGEKPLDKAAVGRLLASLARHGADPDAPAPGGFTPRQAADTLGIPVEW